MCVAGLNVSTCDMNHRWYRLKRSCRSGYDLSTCPEKLKLEGWETRTDHCPWCHGSDSISHGTHLLFGNTPSASPFDQSPTYQVPSCTRSCRSNSENTLSSLSGLSRHSSTTSTGSDQGQRHRDMNERLHRYLNTYPHEILPSAAQNYPTYPQAEIQDTSSSDVPALQKTNSAFKRRWRQSVRLSQTVFRV